ncbi:MAG: hypothetical protein BGP10_06980 [Rhodanobacter sp. 68-29]|uniref:hypothetical protein n=1 Tax=Rhodanobacter sp. PCA2 TaxID=2006117 RepID=UPI00092A60FF|nr:hypothetical protein [Rhodanobacter sp. PCA2]MBA2078754.1 hypothetical protein [Rhodanobacter sp. PCA2]MBN8924918.1 hypothetical protein [Rhodanobacter sp.]OJY56269.1 MAG: hypothetical protein BGP10_06980 [Rhodanobacter sp. 68-29]
MRLLRVVRLGDLGALCDDWAGWTLNRLGLHDPAGRTYRLDAMRAWWITAEQARFWRQGHRLAGDSERLEGASTFAPVVSGQGEASRRETARPDRLRDAAAPAHPLSLPRRAAAGAIDYRTRRPRKARVARLRSSTREACKPHEQKADRCPCLR